MEYVNCQCVGFIAKKKNTVAFKFLIFRPFALRYKLFSCTTMVRLKPFLRDFDRRNSERLRVLYQSKTLLDEANLVRYFSVEKQWDAFWWLI